MDRDRLEHAYRIARDALLAERTTAGHWVGELSTSALSTATAVAALATVQREREPPGPHDGLIRNGLAWLAQHQNADGGWGDTVVSISNISTTLLCKSAIHLAGQSDAYTEVLKKVDRHLAERHGRTPAELAEAVRRRYGKDRTFAVPILTTMALADLVPWKEVPSLPFELACLPMQWFPALRLPVVSYALPALIAVGQAIYHHRKPWNPFARLARWLARKKSLHVLEMIQPDSGGFLEAIPLTSFVTLCLASIGHEKHTVTRHGVQFITESARPDGSWPIDSNLATWVTTLAINALAVAGELPNLERKSGVRSWLTRQQFKSWHPYTNARPGGWGWTDLPGSVPDADDTAGALLALFHLTEEVPEEKHELTPRGLVRGMVADYDTDTAAQLPRGPDLSWESRPPIHDGMAWLLRLQNADGGWPTFCRGWGTLPFDRSGTDLTAHALRAFRAWKKHIDVDQEYRPHLKTEVGVATMPGFPLPDPDGEIADGFDYLAKTQRADGSWLPLWFGNQHAPDDENPTYGTAKVLAAYRDHDLLADEAAQKAIRWLLNAQNDDGGWGGGKGTPSSIEETALTVDVLVGIPEAHSASERGLDWLVAQVAAGGLQNPTPIGFYFAKLWYYEKLYPIIFSVAALGRARRRASHIPGAEASSEAIRAAHQPSDAVRPPSTNPPQA